MLVAFAMGMANLVWMAALTAVMTLEKRARSGALLARLAGVWMVVVGIAIVAGPMLGWA
jgi:predicted metal-binding membrane protein